MAQHSISKSFQNKVAELLTSIADYYYGQGFDGYDEAISFKEILYQTIEKVSCAPLQYSSYWGNPQRRCFFDFKSNQYTLILLYSPPQAETNQDVEKLIFTNIYPSVSAQGNTKSNKANVNIEDLF